MELPLAGLRILSIEQYGAGPFGTQQLADLGAEVIKVENRAMGGDYARALGPYFADGAKADEGSLFFQSINRNKKSIALDISDPEGRKVFLRLVAQADAVTNNLRGDVPEKLGITFDRLKGANRAIVCAHCSAYGRTGPRRSWPGYDFLMQAEAGYFHMSGEPDTPPARMGLSVVDFMAGTYMALGMLAAVHGAKSTGLGRDVDVTLYDTALFNLSYLSAWALNSDYQPNRIARSAHASLVPCQLYKTADGWIYIMCNKEKFWQTLCEKIDRPDLTQHRRFAGFTKRLAARDELTTILDGALAAHTTDQWLDIFAGKVPAAPVRTPAQALNDPDLRVRNAIGHVALGAGDGIDLLRSPIQVSNTGTDHSCPPLGENTNQVLSNAGFSEHEITKLREIGII